MLAVKDAGSQFVPCRAWLAFVARLLLKCPASQHAWCSCASLGLILLQDAACSVCAYRLYVCIGVMVIVLQLKPQPRVAAFPSRVQPELDQWQMHHSAATCWLLLLPPLVLSIRLPSVTADKCRVWRGSAGQLVVPVRAAHDPWAALR